MTLSLEGKPVPVSLPKEFKGRLVPCSGLTHITILGRWLKRCPKDRDEQSKVLAVNPTIGRCS